MGGVRDAATIDLVTHDPKTDEVVLVMTETRPWDAKGAHLLDLQAKLQTYLTFIESGQLGAKFPRMMGKSIRIRVDCAQPPGPLEDKFLQRVRTEWLDPLGITLEVGQLEPQR